MTHQRWRGDGTYGWEMRRQYVYLVSWTAEECEAIRTVTPSNNDDNNHRIPEDIEGRLARRRSHDEDVDGERDGDRRGITLVVAVHEMMMMIGNIQVSCQSIRLIRFIVVSTALTLESLFESRYRIPKLSTWICNWIESIPEILMTSNTFLHEFLFVSFFDWKFLFSMILGNGLIPKCDAYDISSLSWSCLNIGVQGMNDQNFIVVVISE